MPEEVCENFLSPDQKTRDDLKKMDLLPADGYRDIVSYAMHEPTHIKAGGNTQVNILPITILRVLLVVCNAKKQG